MRLEQLNLDFFGHFTNKNFDFGSQSKSGSDFHVIYGPNEAGKTTIMEAYLRLLYGFPTEEPYRFQHLRKNLRVSGTLEIDGQQRIFSRVPTRSNSLLDQHGTILSDSSLQAHLGGLSLEDYRNLLCIDDETIEKGGKEIVNSKGDIGTLLFSAAAGIGDLTDVLATVSQSANELYRKRAVKTKLAFLKKEHADVEKLIKDLDVPASSYRKFRQAYDLALTTEQSVEKERKDLYKQQTQLEAVISALPLLTQIDELDNKLLPFESYPQRLDVKPEQLVTLLTNQSKAGNDAERLKAEKQTLDEALESVVYDPDHLMLDEALTALDQLKSLTMAAVHDADKQRRKCTKALDDMKRTMQDLGVGEEVDPLELIVAPSVLLEFQQACDGLNELSFSVKNERSEIETLKEAVDVQEKECVELEKALPVESTLIETLERFSADELFIQYKEGRQHVDRAEQDYLSALDALASKGQRFESIPECPLNAEELEELINELQALSLERESGRKESDINKTEIAASVAQVEQIHKIDGLVSDEQTRLFKEERNAVWSTHKDSLTLASADAFEVTMRKLDDVMEARQSHANDLGGLRQIEYALLQKNAKEDALTNRVSDLAAKIEARKSRINDAEVRSGIRDSLSPKAYLSWVRKWQDAVSRESELQQHTAKYSSVFEKAHRLSEVLSAHVHLDSPGFADLMAEAKVLEAGQRAEIEKLRIARTRLSDSERVMQTRTAKLERLVDASTNAQANWQELVDVAFSGQVKAERLQVTMQPLHELRELEKERVAASRQVSEMEHDQVQFAQRVKALALSVDVDVADSPLEGFEILRQMSVAAQTGQQNFENLSVKSSECTDKLTATEQVLADIASQVKESGELFPEAVPTNTLIELRVAVDDALQAIDNRSKKVLLESELLGKLAADSMVNARAQIEALTITAQQAELKEVQASIELVEEQYKSAIAQRAESKKELDSVTGDAEVALLDQRKISLALEMTDVALQYLKLNTGLRLAEEAIRRYRDTHRSGMMQATENWFAELTNSAYQKLQTQTDGSSEVLMAVDKAGTPKQVQDMSKGTRFQLYLALRAAAYEQLCSQGKCLPFVCDDIFETFDEQRTRSACQMLDRIGQTGQAIYLTHHRHVVDIAMEVCGDKVTIHSIN